MINYTIEGVTYITYQLMKIKLFTVTIYVHIHIYAQIHDYSLTIHQFCLYNITNKHCLNLDSELAERISTGILFHTVIMPIVKQNDQRLLCCNHNNFYQE